MWRNLKTLSNFALQAAPIFWRKVQEERKRPVHLSLKIPDLSRWSDKGVHAAWIGHSTVLLRVDGFTILTDPVLSTRIGIGIGPLVIGLAIVGPMLGVITLFGVAVAGISATLIQFWFRAQVKRSLFRRRHVSSRIATFAEALSSITWAGAGALVVISLWPAVVAGLVALAILAGAWMLSPKRHWNPFSISSWRWRPAIISSTSIICSHRAATAGR